MPVSKSVRRLKSKRVTVIFDGERYDYQTTPYTAAWLNEQVSLQAAMSQAIGEFLDRNELPSLGVAVERYGPAQTVMTIALYELMQRH